MAYTRDSNLDITLGDANWESVLSDGVTLWALKLLNNSTVAEAYQVTTRARDATKDINLCLLYTSPSPRDS